MHSSRMRNTRWLTVSQHALAGGVCVSQHALGKGVSAQGGGVVYAFGGSAQGCVADTPPRTE